MHYSQHIAGAQGKNVSQGSQFQNGKQGNTVGAVNLMILFG